MRSVGSAAAPSGVRMRIDALRRPLTLNRSMRELTGASTVAIVGVLIAGGLHGSYNGSTLSVGVAYAIVAVGMVVQIGYSHQLAFSQSAFMGLGAYGTAVLEVDHGWSPVASLVAVVVVGAVVSIVVGAFVTRVSGLALALATLLLPLILEQLATYSQFLGGFSGISGVAVLWSGSSYEAGIAHTGIVAALVLGLASFVAWRLRRSDVGLQLAVLAEDEALAESVGVRLRQRKLELFVVGSIFATVGGALVASLQGVSTPTLLGLPAELTLLTMLFLGGRRSVLGAIVGAATLEWLQTRSTAISSHLLLIEGPLLLVVLLVEPEGLGGGVGRLTKALSTRWQAARGLGLDGTEDEPVPPTALAALGRCAVPAGALLRADNVSRRYGGVLAVAGVSLELPERGIVGLCGANGAGKSTLFNLLAGSTKADGGEIFFGTRRLTALSATDRSRLGLARTWQTVRLVDDRTVLDNVAVAALERPGRRLLAAVVRPRERQALRRAAEVLAGLGLSELSNVDVAFLTLEKRRMVELARAVAASPAILLADEPASGLSVPEREHLAAVLEAVAESRVVLLVEHDLELLEKVSARICAMENGEIVFDDDVEHFRSSPVRQHLRGLEMA